MISRRLSGHFPLSISVYVALLLSLLIISRTSNAHENHQAVGINTTTNPQTVTIGVLVKRGVERCQEKWGPTADYLTENISEYSFEIRPLKYDKVNAAVENGEVDFVLANSSIYIELEHYYGTSRIL